MSSFITKNQVKYIFLGLGISFVGASTTFSPFFGINIFPYGTYLIPLYVVLVAYAIFKYQLMDIYVFIQKSVIYTLSATLLTVFFMVIVNIAEKKFQNVIGYQSFVGQILMVTLLALIFIPLMNIIQNLPKKTL